LWLPFDEDRLPAVLGMTRGEVFPWIRNDGSHTLAQLAARKHIKIDALAARLVANRRAAARRSAGACAPTPAG